MFQYHRRKIALKKITYVIIPLQIIFLILILIGLWELIAYNSQNFHAFLILVFVGFLLFIFAIIDIESGLIVKEEFLEPYQAEKIHEFDMK